MKNAKTNLLNINKYVRGKTLIPGKLVFAGGDPIFRVFPRFAKWGPNLSMFWLGAELVLIGIFKQRRNRGIK